MVDNVFVCQWPENDCPWLLMRYMAPELFDSRGKITEKVQKQHPTVVILCLSRSNELDVLSLCWKLKVDVWALGCLVVEVISSRLPHEASCPTCWGTLDVSWGFSQSKANQPLVWHLYINPLHPFPVFHRSAHQSSKSWRDLFAVFDGWRKRAYNWTRSSCPPLRKTLVEKQLPFNDWSEHKESNPECPYHK